MNIMEKAAELISQRVPFALATVVSSKGSTPRSTAAKMIIFKDKSIYDTIGGGPVEAKTIEEAAEAIKEGKPRMLRYRLNNQAEGGLPMLCGGDMDIFIDVYKQIPHVVIIGGGHVGYAIANAVRIVGWEFSVVEEREEFSSEERFPGAKKIYRDGDIKAAAVLEADDNTFIVIVTKDHDKGTLRKVINKNAGYIGMIGSRRKVAIVMKELADEGISPVLLEKVHAPIGININAETPEEIAFSVISEMIGVYRGAKLDTLNK